MRVPVSGDDELSNLARDVNHMLADLEQAEDAVASLRRRLVAAQEDERRNVARELHDEIG